LSNWRIRCVTAMALGLETAHAQQLLTPQIVFVPRASV
jgi:hypothetical protein